jgi:Zn-dependent M28 family amino/carboxypeptidase
MRDWERLRRSLQGSPFQEPERLRAEPEESSRPALPTILINETMARALFAGERADADAVLQATPPEGFALSDNKRLAFNAALRIERVPTSNVIAVIEGSDPKLKSEYVALSCHYDHVGVSRRQTAGDRIFNGADDNGSGTVTLLAVAEAMAKAKKRPKRSFLFIWHTGEEHGLWGSHYFTKYPTVPLDKITALINIDMIGRSRKPDDKNPRNKDLSGQNEVYVIGATLMSTELENLCKRVNEGYLKLQYNYRYDDPKDPERFFFRSDHFFYAQKGIPALFYFNGVHEDYHGVGDEPQKIDYERMEKIVRTIFRTLWELAQAKDRPKVDKKLPPELTGGR